MNLHFINIRRIYSSVERSAEQLKTKVEAILSEQPDVKITLIGHSLGGLISRYYIQRLGGKEKVRRLITIGTPHHGTEAACFGFGVAAAQIVPGSRFLQELNAPGNLDETVPMISIYSDFDQLVYPSTAAVLPSPQKSIEVPYLGHLSLLYSKRVFRAIRELELESKNQAPFD